MKVTNDCPVNTCWSCPNAESTKSTCVEVRCTPCFDSLMKKHDAEIEKEKSKSFHSGKRKSKRPKIQTDAKDMCAMASKTKTTNGHVCCHTDPTTFNQSDRMYLIGSWAERMRNSGKKLGSCCVGCGGPIVK